MQPYFVPYAGYFRLFAAADVFVAYDCVQFPRRGWVHRNRLPTAAGMSDWLTLPVAKCGRDTRIADLQFSPGAAALIAQRMRRFPLLREAEQRASPLFGLVRDLGGGSVADYLCTQLGCFQEILGLARPMVRSSTLDIDAGLHGQDRVIAICRALGANRYVNSPGGRELYQYEAFARHRIELDFLPPFTGPAESILAPLLTQTPAAVGELIRRETPGTH